MSEGKTCCTSCSTGSSPCCATSHDHELAKSLPEYDPVLFAGYIDFEQKPIRWKLKKGRALARRMEFQGLDISIETDKGQQRHWYDPHAQKEGTTTMKYPYGYIRRTMGADDEHVDCYVGPNEDSQDVFIVHQRKAPTFSEYDEDKVMLGFTSAREAKAAYLEHFNNPRFFGTMTETKLDDFKRMFVKDAAEKSLSPELDALKAHYKSYEMRKSLALGKGVMNTVRKLWSKIVRTFHGEDNVPTKTWRRGAPEAECRHGICPRNEGRTIPVDEEFEPGVYGPPIHPHCFCHLEFDEDGEKSLPAPDLEKAGMMPGMMPPAMPPMPGMMNPMMGMMPDPHDVETFEGVMSLLNRLGSSKDPELMEIASKVWGEGYVYEGQSPLQARAELLGFLLDQRDLLGVEPEMPIYDPSQSLLGLTPSGSVDSSGTSPSSPSESNMSPEGISSAGASPPPSSNDWSRQDF